MPALEKSVLVRLKARIKAVPETELKKFRSDGNAGRDVDCLIVTHGQAIFFELKMPGMGEDAAKPHQRAKLRRWAKAGAVVGCSDSVDEIMRVVTETRHAAILKDKLLAEFQKCMDAVK
jgi:hypothetical protein